MPLRVNAPGRLALDQPPVRVVHLGNGPADPVPRSPESSVSGRSGRLGRLGRKFLEAELCGHLCVLSTPNGRSAGHSIYQSDIILIDGSQELSQRPTGRYGRARPPCGVRVPPAHLSRPLRHSPLIRTRRIVGCAEPRPARWSRGDTRRVPARLMRRSAAQACGAPLGARHAGRATIKTAFTVAGSSPGWRGAAVL